MNNIEIYTRDLCSFCDKAKQVFNSYNLKYTEYNIYKNPNFLEKSRIFVANSNQEASPSGAT